MRVLQIMSGGKPEPGNRQNIFIHRQIASLKPLISDMQVIYAGLGSRPHDMIALVGKLRRTIRRFQPEVIHAQYATALGAVTVMAAGNIPTVVSFCGDEVYGTYVNEHSTKSWRTSLGQKLSQYCARQATLCHVHNETMRDIVSQWGAKRIENMTKGVNLALFKELDRSVCREKLGLKPDGQYVVFAIRDNDYVKRRDLAEKAIELCNQSMSQPVELLVLDKVAPDLVPLYLNAGNVLLLCSNHEGSPNIVKEALACNSLVVSTDVGDVRDRFGEVNGLFLVQQEPSDIARGLQQAMQFKRSNGRDFVMNISEDKIAQRLFDLYQSIQRPQASQFVRR